MRRQSVAPETGPNCPHPRSLILLGVSLLLLGVLPLATGAPAWADDSVSGNLTGQIYPENPMDTPIIDQPLDKVVIATSDISTFFLFFPTTDTDFGGHFSAGGLDCSAGCKIRAEFSDSFGAPFHVVNFKGITIPASSVPPVHGAEISFSSGAQDVDIDLANGQYDYVKQASNVWYHLHRARQFFSSGGAFDFFTFPSDGRILVFLDRPASDDFDACSSHVASVSSSGLVTSEIEEDFDFFMSFNEAQASATPTCTAGAYSADIIYHEFGHVVSILAYGSYYDNMKEIIAGQSLLEGISDYWAATLTDDPVIGEGLLMNSSGLRTLANDLTLVDDYVYHPDYIYQNGSILGGALWDLRTEFIGLHPYDLAAGKQEANELIFKALKLYQPQYFDDFGLAILKADGNGDEYNAPHKDIICRAFYTLHKIDIHDHCVQEPEPPPDPEDPSDPGIHKVTVPIRSTSIDLDFSRVIGSVTSEDLVNFSVVVRPYGAPNQTVTSATISLGGSGGVENVEDELLAVLDSSALKNGCYYNVELSATLEDGTTHGDTVTVKHMGLRHDPMPRMVCLSRTANEGAENDACQVVAFVSDPKPAYYSMSSTDWRRGRSHLIASRPSYQFNPSDFDPGFYGPALCDPDNNGGDCMRDCWNITGTAGNRSSGNDGLDDIFCAAGAGCSPVSFSGCEATNWTCVSSARTSLEAAYHKVLYMHYSSWEYLGFFLWSQHGRIFKRCDDDNGGQCYSLLEAVDDDDNPKRPYLNPRAAPDRTGVGNPEDIFDRFGELYSKTPETAASLLNKWDADLAPRVGIDPAPNCGSCGCPDSTAPFCNTSSGVCESRCSDGTPFGDCTMNGSYIEYCDNGTLVPGCNLPQCMALSCGGDLMCNASNGRCVECITGADCDDGNLCTTDSCYYGTCRNVMPPNDCYLLTAACGPSPSGCYFCGCDSCAEVCSLSGVKPNLYYACVPKVPCDDYKCDACSRLRHPKLPVFD